MSSRRIKAGGPSTGKPRAKTSISRPHPGVLVVDADVLMRIMLKLGLQRHGFQVWHANSAVEAVDLYRQNRQAIGVVLLGLNMLGHDGRWTSQGLPEFETHLPVCFLADQPGDCAPSNILQRGVAHLFTKPFQMDEIIRVVTRLARKSPGTTTMTRG